MCPISAFAEVTDTNSYNIASDKPTVTDYSGYAELLFEDSSGERFVTVVSWFFTPDVNTSSEFYFASDKPNLTIDCNSYQFNLNVSTNEYVNGNMSFISIDSRSNIKFSNLEILSDSSVKTYTLSYGIFYDLIGIHYYGDFVSYDVPSSATKEEFYVVYGSDVVISHGIGKLISSMYTLIEYLDDNSYKEQLDDIISKLNSIDSSVSDWYSVYNTNMLNLLWHLQDISNYLYMDLSDDLDYVKDSLDGISNLLFEINGWVYYIYEYMPWLYEELLNINSKLQTIITLLNAQGDKEEFTQPDNSDMDNYYDVENGLLDSGSSDVGGVVNVTMNENAMSVIWNWVERVLNSNSKIMGMVLTVLSLGIIALILGR